MYKIKGKYKSPLGKLKISNCWICYILNPNVTKNRLYYGLINYIGEETYIQSNCLLKKEWESSRNSFWKMNGLLCEIINDNIDVRELFNSNIENLSNKKIKDLESEVDKINKDKTDEIIHIKQEYIQEKEEINKKYELLKKELSLTEFKDKLDLF